MRQFVSKYTRQAIGLLALCAACLTACVTPYWGWTGGVACFSAFALSVCVASLYSSRSLALAVALLAAAGCYAEIWFAPPDASRNVAWLLSGCAACTMIGLSLVLVRGVHGPRSFGASQGHVPLRGVGENPGSSDGRDLHDRSDTRDDSVHFPMLLLALQDIGRRISTNLDLDTLAPTIISTGQISLKCRICELYFWNGKEGTLEHASSPNEPHRSVSLPHPPGGMIGWVIEHRKILTRRELESNPSLSYLLEHEPNPPDAVAPLTVGGELLGLLVVDKVADDSADFVRLLYILANISALGIKNAMLFKRIEDMARRDGLTGLLNHAGFHEELNRRVQQATAQSGRLTVVMSDVDHFKKFNDTYGHQAGDHVLREVARFWKAIMPDHAVLGRYGGEEFVCFLPDEGLSRGRELAESLRAHLESNTFDFEGQELRVTASFGVAEFGQPATTSTELIRLADRALYQAKDSGRNCVICSEPPVPPVEMQLRTSDVGEKLPPEASFSSVPQH